MHFPMPGVEFPRLGVWTMSVDFCPECHKPAATFRLVDGRWVCHFCVPRLEFIGCRLFEYGHENPSDPGGSTAHVRDIKDRRWHPQEKRTFYYSKELGKTYFLPK